jgi:uncharacterized membrane protein YesL
LLWIALSALGLFVLGIAPATCAVADVLRRKREGYGVKLLSGTWSFYRREFVRSNLRMLPLMLVQFAAIGTIRTAFAGGVLGAPQVLTVGISVAGLAWSTVSLAMMVACERIRRQDFLVTYRLALLLPGALPFRSIAVLVLVTLWASVCITIVPLAILLGAGIAAELTGVLLTRHVDSLLERIDLATTSRLSLNDHGSGDGSGQEATTSAD